eukprot:3732534-Amphidinium_carterae.1
MEAHKQSGKCGGYASLRLSVQVWFMVWKTYTLKHMVGSCGRPRRSGGVAVDWAIAVCLVRTLGLGMASSYLYRVYALCDVQGEVVLCLWCLRTELGDAVVAAVA